MISGCRWSAGPLGKGVGEPIGAGAGVDDVAAEKRQSTIVAQRRGSVKVLVQLEKLSLKAMATEFFILEQLHPGPHSGLPAGP